MDTTILTFLVGCLVSALAFMLKREFDDTDRWRAEMDARIDALEHHREEIGERVARVEERSKALPHPPSVH